MTRAGVTASTVTLWLLLSCANQGCERAREGSLPEQNAAVRVHALRVRRGEITDTLSVTGETAALSFLRLSSPVAGRVTMLEVRPGDRLATGDVAVRVRPLENEAALHGLALLKDADVLGAEEAHTAGQLRKDLGARDIPLRAPFPAVVAERLHNPGEQVAPNDVLLELFDPNSIYVVAQVPVEAAPRLAVGMPVEVTSNGIVVAGRVAALAGALVPQSLTLPVRIALTASPQPPLLHAAVECRITLAHHSGTTVIPRSALVSSIAAERGTVMVAVQDHAQQRTIELGLRTAGEVEVTDGLAVGDLVLTEGHYALADGSRIEAVLASE